MSFNDRWDMGLTFRGTGEIHGECRGIQGRGKDSSEMVKSPIERKS